MRVFIPLLILFFICMTSGLKSSEQPNIELFGIYSEIDGIEHRYTTGKSFPDMDECQRTLISYNNLFMNFKFQGLQFAGKLKFICARVLPTIQLNTE